MIDEYLNRLVTRLGSLDLGMVTRRYAPISELYADCPSRVDLSLRVAAGQAADWVASPASALGEAAAGDINAALEAGATAPALVAALLGHVDRMIADSRLVDFSLPGVAPLIRSPLWQDGEKVNAITLTLSDCLGLFRRSIVTGPPGGGKSVLAKHLVVEAAQSIADNGAAAESTGLRHWQPSISVPAYIDLRSFVDFCRWEDSGTARVTAAGVFDYLKTTYMDGLSEESAQTVRRAIERGRALLVFDGLDEIAIPPTSTGASDRREQLRYLMEAVWRELSPSRIILTSRDYAYSDWQVPHFERIDMGPLGDGTLYTIVRNLMKFSDDIGDTNLDAQARALVQAMESSLPGDLRERPLFASLLTGVYARRAAIGRPELPSRPIDLYEESVTLLLNRWTKTDPEGNLLDRLGCTTEQLREMMEALAFNAQLAYGVEEDDFSSPPGVVRGFPDYTLLRVLAIIPGRIDVQQIIAYLNRETGLLLSPQPGRYEFAHRSFGEYLAARWLTRVSTDSDDWLKLPELMDNNPRVWRETLRMLGLILVEDRRRPDLWLLIEALAERASTAIATTAGGPPPGAWCLWLAAMLINDLLHNDLPAGSAPSKQQRSVAGDVVKDLEGGSNSSARFGLPLAERAEAWNLHSRISHSLRRLDHSPQPPKVDWCAIPAGEFRMGLSQADADRYRLLNGPTNWAPGREMPAGEIHVPAYRISKFTITRREFSMFLKAADGYCDDDNWHPGHIAFRSPDITALLTDPDGSRLPDAPRTEVSWFDACTYATWLGQRLGLKITLPTEPQWEKAARGTDGRFFPWGDKFRPDRCNSQESGFGELEAVGGFEVTGHPWRDDSPRDMSGNVWEWCSTICEVSGSTDTFQYPYSPNDGRESPDGDLQWLRVVRGGCYLNPAHNMMTTFRGRDKPDMRALRQGFRVALWEETGVPCD